MRKRDRDFGIRSAEFGIEDSAFRIPHSALKLSDEAIRRERAKARELRRSQWWKRRCSSGICHYCGKQVGAKALTMDHLVPLARGGRSNKGNLVPACKRCNNEKKHKLAFEFEERQ